MSVFRVMLMCPLLVSGAGLSRTIFCALLGGVLVRQFLVFPASRHLVLSDVRREAVHSPFVFILRARLLLQQHADLCNF